MFPPIEKFIVIYSARTGSNFLRSLLNNHPQIVCDNDLFFENELFDMPHGPFEYIEEIVSQNSIKAAYGYKLSIYQIDQMKNIKSPMSFLSQVNVDGWKIIHLYRSDVVRQSFSLLKAQKTQTYHIVEGNVLQKNKIALSLSEIFRTVYALKYSRIHEERILKSIPHIRINYEYDLAGPGSYQSAIDRICSFLYITAVKVTADSIRTSGKAIGDDIIHGTGLYILASIYVVIVFPLIWVSEAIHFYRYSD